MDRKNIAGMSIKGGRKDNFYFCLLEYYSDSDRWFLRSLLQVKDEEDMHGDEAIREWIETYNIKQMMVDFPLTYPPCFSCQLDCPGSTKCPVDAVHHSRNKIAELLSEDEQKMKLNPKNYEFERNKDDEFDYQKDVLARSSDQHLLSRPFKRRLKRGVNPYWNRPLDMWVWMNYYDALLDLFNLSFDSFGNTSLIIMSRFSYLKRHFPKSLQMMEGHVFLVLIELMRAKYIKKSDLMGLGDMEGASTARLNIIKAIEEKLKLFIYAHDLEILSRTPRAFESFLLAMAGICFHSKSIKLVPQWAGEGGEKFVVPIFNS